MRKYRAFEELLDEDLKDPECAAEYLNAAMEENDPEFLLLCLGDVARAHGMTGFAKKAAISRVGLYKSVSKKGNPGLQTFISMLKASGLRLSFSAA